MRRTSTTGSISPGTSIAAAPQPLCTTVSGVSTSHPSLTGRGSADTDTDTDDVCFPTGPTASIERFSNAAHQALLEVARRRREDFPGLLEHLEDNVALHVGLGSHRAARGWFRCSGLLVNGRPVDEIHLNIEPELPRLSDTPRSAVPARVGEIMKSAPSAASHADAAVQTLTTLIHEATHAWNSINDIKDCCRGGRYHNRRFGEPAVDLGLAVVPHPTQGVITPGLLPWAHIDYSDLLDSMGQALVLSRRQIQSETDAEAPDSQPEMSGDASATPTAPGEAKYASATCACTDQRGASRRLRMARSAWEVGPVRCGVCDEDFAVR